MKKSVLIIIAVVVILFVIIRYFMLKIGDFKINGSKSVDLTKLSQSELRQTLTGVNEKIVYYNVTGNFYTNMKGNFTGNNFEMISNGSLSGYVDRERQEYYIKQRFLLFQEAINQGQGGGIHLNQEFLTSTQSVIQ